MKLLIVEDEEDLANALKRGFQKAGYAVDVALDGGEGLELYGVNSYDLILLDLNLPVLDGLEVLKAIRKRDKLQRVLILSARSAVENRIEGLDLGANDYLAKPFDFGELSARVRSLLRRSFLQESSVVHCGLITLRTDLKQLEAGGKPLETTAKEYALIEYLVLHAGKVVSAEELIEHVWDSEADFFSAAVKVHISNLRRKLKQACGRELIVTQRGQGYLIEKEEEGK